MEYKRHPENVLNDIISVIFIYPMIVPLVVFDFFLEIYHNACFRLYGIPLIERSKYVRVDRHKLSYLNPLEKVNCAYCGYANGLLNYAVKIAGETEVYWCGIKHQANNGFVEPAHQKNFIKYGDEVAYRNFGPRRRFRIWRGKDAKVCAIIKD